jgi:hypothetical protein
MLHRDKDPGVVWIGGNPEYKIHAHQTIVIDSLSDANISDDFSKR